MREQPQLLFTESNRGPDTKISRMKRRRTPSNVASATHTSHRADCFSVKGQSEFVRPTKPGHRRTLVDLKRIKSALETVEDGWTTEESVPDTREARRRRVGDEDSNSETRSIEPGEIVSDMDSDEDMDISDSDFGAGQSSGPTTDTTPERSLSPSLTKTDSSQSLKEGPPKSPSPNASALQRTDTLQAIPQESQRKVPPMRKPEAAPSAQVKIPKPGPSSQFPEAGPSLVPVVPEKTVSSDAPHTSPTPAIESLSVSQEDEVDREQTPATPAAVDHRSAVAAGKAKQMPSEEKGIDHGAEADVEGEVLAAGAGGESDDSEYHPEDSDDTSLSDQELELILGQDVEDEDEPEDDSGYLRLMPRSVLEKMLQRLLKPPQSQQTRRAVQSLIQENLPETLASYDTSLRIKINETHTTMMQEMQEEHSSLTSDDFAHVMARFLRNEVKVLHSFPGSSPATFELILYLAEHSFGDLELDDRPGFGDREAFDSAADRALLYVAEERLQEEGPVFRAAIPGYLETIRSQAMYLYRHGRHPKTWFPATIAFLQSSLQTSNTKKCCRLRSATR